MLARRPDEERCRLCGSGNRSDNFVEVRGRRPAQGLSWWRDLVSPTSVLLTGESDESVADSAAWGIGAVSLWSLGPDDQKKRQDG